MDSGKVEEEREGPDGRCEEVIAWDIELFGDDKGVSAEEVDDECMYTMVVGDGE